MAIAKHQKRGNRVFSGEIRLNPHVKPCPFTGTGLMSHTGTSLAVF
jgi:hypothetical protein